VEAAVGDGRVSRDKRNPRMAEPSAAAWPSGVWRAPGLVTGPAPGFAGLDCRLGGSNLWHVGAHLKQATGQCEQEVTTLLNQAHRGESRVPAWFPSAAEVNSGAPGMSVPPHLDFAEGAGSRP